MRGALNAEGDIVSSSPGLQYLSAFGTYPGKRFVAVFQVDAIVNFQVDPKGNYTKVVNSAQASRGPSLAPS